MTAAQEVCRHLAAIGATIEPAGDSLLLRAGPKPVPAAIIRCVREAKPELLALLQQKAAPLASELRFARVINAKGEPGLEQPCAARRGWVQELDRTFLHFCVHCGRFAAFGYGVHLTAGRLGRWYCGEHRPGAADNCPRPNAIGNLSP